MGMISRGFDVSMRFVDPFLILVHVACGECASKCLVINQPGGSYQVAGKRHDTMAEGDGERTRPRGKACVRCR